MLINDSALEAGFEGFKTVFNNSFEAAKSHKDTVAMGVNSTTTKENYDWFGQFPSMRKWVSDRINKQLQSHDFRICNELFESTIHVKRTDMEDDCVGICKPLFAEMSRTTKRLETV